jgi:hypothetical protein
MNKLSLEKKVQVIQQLVEGTSINATSRITNVSKPAILKLLGEVGRACLRFHNETVKNVYCRKLQCDEIWSFVYAKEKNKPDNMKDVGDIWTWTGICADTKLIVGWFVGNRDAESALIFMNDLEKRLSRRVQLTTDGLHAYLEAVTDSFGSQVDFAQLVKLYGKEGSTGNTEKKYSQGYV